MGAWNGHVYKAFTGGSEAESYLRIIFSGSQARVPSRENLLERRENAGGHLPMFKQKGTKGRRIES